MSLTKYIFKAAAADPQSELDNVGAALAMAANCEIIAS